MVEYYTVQEAAQILHVNERTVREWIKNGKLVGKKLGRRWLIPESEVDQVPEKPSAEAEQHLLGAQNLPTITEMN